MSTSNKVYNDIANLNLWIKWKLGDRLSMGDVPGIIPYRWQYLKDNWSDIKRYVTNLMATSVDPDGLQTQLYLLSSFIETQRVSTMKINPLDDAAVFYRYFLVWGLIPIDITSITDEEQRVINAAIDIVRIYSRNNFIDIKNAVVAARDRLTDSVKAGDADYNTVVGRSSIPGYIDITIEDVKLMQEYQNVIKTTDFILANLFSEKIGFVDPFALAKANANNPNININSYASGKLARMNFGENLESLANRFLGNPDKWIEIAIANGLKPPYVDEMGENLFLLSNANGNLINVAKMDVGGKRNKDKFYVNQVVLLQSDTQTFPDQRIVANVREVPISGELIIELNGDPDLNRFTIADSANIRIFKPNTINSRFFVLIPSNEPIDAQYTDTPWFLRSRAEDEKQAKVDLALDSYGDIGFTSDGDFQLSYGLANAIQAIKLKMSIENGSLVRHPYFGLVAIQGETNRNIDDVRGKITNSIQQMILRDKRFDRLESLSVAYFGHGLEGPVGYSISLTVRLAGGSNVIPISFNISIR